MNICVQMYVCPHACLCEYGCSRDTVLAIAHLFAPAQSYPWIAIHHGEGLDLPSSELLGGWTPIDPCSRKKDLSH